MMRSFAGDWTRLFLVLALSVAATGCGGGGGGTTGGGSSTSTSTVSGTAEDGLIAGATVRFFTDAALTNEIFPRGAVTTNGSGQFTATFTNPSPLPKQVFIQTTGGTDTSDNSAAITLTGVSNVLPNGTVSARINANGVSSAVVSLMAGGGADTPDEAYAQLRSLFPDLPADPTSFNSNASGTLQGNLGLVHAAFINAGGTVGIRNLILGLLQGGTVPPALVLAAQNLGLTIRTDASFFFAVTQVTVAGQVLLAPSTLDTTGRAVFGTPANAIDISGTTPLPQVAISASNSATGFLTGTVFGNGDLTLEIIGTGSDNRRMKVTVTPAVATVGSAGDVTFSIPAGAGITFEGTDSGGQAVPSFAISNLGADQIAIASAAGQTFTFNTDALVNQLRARFPSLEFDTSHPAFMIASAGTYDLKFTVAGIPFGLAPRANGFGELLVNAVVITGQHDF